MTARRQPRLGPLARAERRAKAAEPAAKALWEKAAALSDAPWKLVAERLGINPAVALRLMPHGLRSRNWNQVRLRGISRFTF